MNLEAFPKDTEVVSEYIIILFFLKKMGKQHWDKTSAFRLMGDKRPKSFMNCEHKLFVQP